MRFLIFAISLCLFSAPAVAQDQTQFDIRFRGVTVANITVATRETASTYALAGQVRAAGLAGLFADIRFDMAAEGRLSQSDPQPIRYREDVDTGRRQTTVSMQWVGRTPQITRQTPAPGPEAVPPEAATGMIDPLSALWQVLRDRPVGTLCDRVMQVFDGARQSQLRLAAAEIADTSAECAGEYRRLAGFSQSDMNERQRFPFTARYTRHGDLWRLTEVEASSLFGRIRIQRRD